MRKSQRAKLSISKEEELELSRISKSKKSPYREVIRSTILLKYIENQTITSIAVDCNTNRPLVERCIDKAIAYGVMTALKDLPGRGVKPKITDDAKSWVLSLASTSLKEIGYANELWTYSLLISHLRKTCHENGHECLSKIGKGVLNGILTKGNIRPHKINYYLEKRDPEFDSKMTTVLHVYKEVSMINDGEIKQKKRATISYDEKPGIQTIKNIAPQLKPIPGK